MRLHEETELERWRQVRRAADTLKAKCRHTWIFNGIFRIKCALVCCPSETRPALICMTVDWNDDVFPSVPSETKAASFRGIQLVIDELRNAVSGVCGVEFIKKCSTQPMHCAHWEES